MRVYLAIARVESVASRENVRKASKSANFEEVNGELARAMFCARAIFYIDDYLGISIFPIFPFGGISSVGRALAWHARGQEFDSPMLHHSMRDGERYWG